MRVNGLIAAMEEVENTLPVDESEAAVTAVAVADESAEIQTEGDDVGVTVSQIEDAVQAGEELEDIAEVAVDAVESGEGLDEKSAEIASIAIEAIRNRIGDYSDVRLVPVTESFGNTNTRLTSTRLIVEGVGDTLKKIWAAIKAGAMRLWEKVKSFFAKLFNSASLLAKHIQSLKIRANAMPSSAAPKEKMIKSGLAKTLSVKGKADLDSYKTISKNTLALSTVADDVSKASRTIVQAAEALAHGDEINQAKVATFLKAEGGAADVVEKTLNAAFTGAEAVFTSGELNAVMKPPKMRKDSTDKVHSYGPFVGNVVLTLRVETGKVLDQEQKRFSLAFGSANVKAAESIQALDLTEVKNILTEAGTLANQLQDFKKTQSNMDAITKSINKVADAVMSNAAKILEKTGSSSETREGLAELKSNVNSAIATLNSFGNRAPSFVFNLAKAGADYASLSMRNLGEK